MIVVSLAVSHGAVTLMTPSGWPSRISGETMMGWAPSRRMTCGSNSRNAGGIICRTASSRFRLNTDSPVDSARR